MALLNAARRKWAILIAAVAICIIASEVISIKVLGLGDPPLSIADPEIEYLFAPNQQVMRFGNRITFNSYSMRSPEFPPKKSPTETLRLLVVGDSVVNGGSLTDDDRLATSILQHKLAPAGVSVVGNISAGSWGPPNHLAYLTRFGTFDADVIVFVYSSHDYFDVPTFTPLDPTTHPTVKPRFATLEGIQRYLPRYVPGAGSKTTDENIDAPRTNAAEQLKQVLALAQSTGADVYLLQHLEREELVRGIPKPGHHEIQELARNLNIPTTTTEKWMTELGLAKAFRDNIHPNDLGQKALANALLDLIEPSLNKAESTTLLQ